MGGSFAQSICPREVVSGREPGQHKLFGAESGEVSSSTLSRRGLQSPCPCPNGQYGNKSTSQPPRRDEIPGLNARDGEAHDLGGTQCAIPQSTTHSRQVQHGGRLAQSNISRSIGVEDPPEFVPEDHTEISRTSRRSIRFSKQRTTSKVFYKVSDSKRGRLRCPQVPLATRSNVRLSTGSLATTGHPESNQGEGGGPTGGTILASESMVCRSHGPLNTTTMANTSQGDLTKSRSHSPSRPRMASVNRLALERILLRKDNVPRDIIETMQAARRPSTIRIYNASWKAFCTWASKSHIDPTSASVIDVLRFLQAGLVKGLAPSTLRRQVAALATVLPGGEYPSLSLHPRIKCFLHGATNIRPPTVHRFPTWDLTLVLQSLTDQPFEPLASVSLRVLTIKVAFLLAITSARRISELAALSIRPDLCIFHTDRVVLRLDPAFITKVNSHFHRTQELILPNFCPDPTHPLERQWHTLDVRRALRRYIKRTASFRKTEALFVSFLPGSMGQKVNSTTIGRWIKACIATAYNKRGAHLPAGVVPHSTRSAAVSAAWSSQASIDEVCRAATWSSISSFVRHYRLDIYASSDASFGRRVLQAVIPENNQDPERSPSQRK